MEIESKRPPAPVKNKMPAPVQISAEQILREATERQAKEKPRPKQRILDHEELGEFQLDKRRGFEDAIRRNRVHVGTWLKYAAFEEGIGEFERARSVYERSLEVDSRNQTLWMKYVEMEMKNKKINHARNIFDRVTSILPRVDLFWYKYTYMEEMLDNVAGARQVFERWMLWEPAEEGWMAYVKFEERYKEHDRARDVFKRFVNVHPQPKNWLKWSKFEEGHGFVDRARTIYEQCIEILGDAYIDQNVYVSFARFEVRQKEIERARMIFKFALDKLPKTQAENLYNSYIQFEKQHGGKEGIEDVVTNKRRAKYESDIAANPKNYDVWFDYCRLEESVGAGNEERIREVYERALAQVPLVMEKRYWRRYIYIWLFYAIWEETVAKDVERAGQVYTQCLKVIPHKTFTFAKVWLLYSKFLVRRLDLTAARKALGQAIGMGPKERLFKGYIELELQLREFDRARKLYEKYLEWSPSNCYAWIKYAELERMLGDVERCRGIFDIAIQQEELDMPEVLWKGYIDFETSEAEYDNVRQLYEQLLQRTEHVKVWISYATFECAALDNGDTPQDRMLACRRLFERANDRLKSQELKQERTLLLEAWKDLESQYGDETSMEAVQSKMPKIVKKRRRVGEDEGIWEEYFDYIFPDDQQDQPNFKFLAMAHEWKMKMAEKAESSESEESEEEEEEKDE